MQKQNLVIVQIWLFFLTKMFQTIRDYFAQKRTKFFSLKPQKIIPAALYRCSLDPNH